MSPPSTSSLRKYRGRVYAVVYNLTANREDASDLTQLPSSSLSVDQPLPRPVVIFHLLYRIAVNSTLTTCGKTAPDLL